MMDIVDRKTRSRMMAGIRSKNTKPELMLRRALHERGLRYRLHARMPGKPDMVFARHRAAVFVHGCFWHRHEGCRYTTQPATRTDFWKEKFATNVARDAAAISTLKDAGWRLAVVWECALRGPDALQGVANLVADWIRGLDDFLEVGSPTAGS